MSQKTLVLRLSLAEGRTLESRLESEGFSFRAVPHARFSAKSRDLVVTLYTSGKLVVQGEDPDSFALRYLGRAPAVPPPLREIAPADAPHLGCDESGKGDVFGPLVAVAFRVEPGQSEGLRLGGVADSKRLTDESVLRIADALRSHFRHAVAVLEPEEYNAVYARTLNLNTLLANLHARAIRELCEPGMTVVVDRFAAEAVLTGVLRPLGVRLVQMPRAEDADPAVAAASILAREQFLRSLRELGDSIAVDLPKGAGRPVDVALRRLVALHGPSVLPRVAKMHFKNVQRIL